MPDCPDFDEWQFFQSESLRQGLASTLEKLAVILSDQADYETAISYTRRRLALDPWHEPTHQQLMQLYVQVGQQAAALRQFDLCRQTLEDELGISPSETTIALCDAIRKGEVEIGPSILLSPPRHNLPTQTTPFIGQERELIDLRRLLNDPATQLVTILAPGGMGKPRLALEAARNHLEAGQDRVCFVELAPLTTGEEIVPVIADAAGFPFQQDERSPEQQLLDYLREKQMRKVWFFTEVQVKVTVVRPGAVCLGFSYRSRFFTWDFFRAISDGLRSHCGERVSGGATVAPGRCRFVSTRKTCELGLQLSLPGLCYLLRTG